ncbi:uncharacterized protein VP01_4027g1, partial [Puccinia sorghi]
MAVFPYLTNDKVNPPEPKKQTVTSSKSLNKLLNSDESANQLPPILPQLTETTTTPDKIDKGSAIPISHLVNTEDQHPMVCRADLDFGNTLAEQNIAAQESNASGVAVATRNQLMPRNYDRAIRRRDGDKWIAAVDTELKNIWDKMLFVIAVRNGLILELFDVTAAYLHREIDEDIWVKVPDRMLVPEEHRGKSLKLDKGLYGTKQGGRCFNVSYYDDLFYHIKRGVETIPVWIHVDNGVVTASSNRAMRDFQSILESKLSVTWDGNLHTIVGIKVERCGNP